MDYQSLTTGSSNSPYDLPLESFAPAQAPVSIDFTAIPAPPLLDMNDAMNFFHESPDTDSSDTQLDASTAALLLPSQPQFQAQAQALSRSVTRSDDKSPKESSNRVSKRQLNTMAARRYRQRRVDRMNQLEAELEQVKRERDELKMRVSKLEGETDALRGLLKTKK